MTDTFIQKLEEKIIILLTEFEDLRFEVQQLKQENANLKADQLNYAQKLQGLISLLDSVDLVDVSMNMPASSAVNTSELEAMQASEKCMAS